MGSKTKPAVSAEASANKKTKPNDPTYNDHHIVPPPLPQPPASGSKTTPEHGINLHGIQPFCFGGDGKQQPKINATCQIVGTADGPNGSLHLVGWDTEHEYSSLKFANQPPKPSTELLWSVVRLNKKKGLR
ncbi:hypothetical protein RvY_02890 [Ramazzottius varieornatus]|uniref:Uncharacterized protein n=1 Tax=Ramazzottius varieornatus TaxID=947166 RepID=A0A1D1URZ1_RAMVA|nr:hypothetical protein RvY_02890 [Ramazzottius varieornatus]